MPPIATNKKAVWKEAKVTVFVYDYPKRIWTGNDYLDIPFQRIKRKKCKITAKCKGMLAVHRAILRENEPEIGRTKYESDPDFYALTHKESGEPILSELNSLPDAIQIGNCLCKQYRYLYEYGASGFPEDTPTWIRLWLNACAMRKSFVSPKPYQR